VTAVLPSSSGKRARTTISMEVASDGVELTSAAAASVCTGYAENDPLAHKFLAADDFNPSEEKAYRNQK
jgi:hypothetical protein